jgi:predicted deacylase
VAVGGEGAGVTTEQAASRIITDADFERDGKQVTELRVPQAHDDSAWGVVPIPIAIVKNGAGPTLMLSAGVHGDEYEGQVALLDLVREIEPEQIQGRLIVIPALHLPAARVGRRLSPIDGLDLNRTFPGDRGGSFAPMLAHYVAEVLLPLCDVNVDLHSGGRSLDCLACTMSHLLDDASVVERTVALARAFGAPLHVMNREVDGSRTLASAAEARGVITMSSELGGGNRLSRRGLEITRRGVRNLLCHLGMTDGEPEPFDQPTRVQVLPDAESYGFAPASGIFCPLHDLGERVEAGQPAAAIYDIENPLQPPVAVEFRRSGLLWSMRGQGRVEKGDAAAVVVTDWQADG